MATPEQQKQLQALSDEYTTLQNARQKLESQQQENKGLVGPILLKQDASEAKSTVDGRLEFIDKEMCVFFYFRLKA
ncbi:unnamed protein product [Aureobasidium mustum]|uniref:Prefoldin subunit 6 n=1 Tax=Aureobasidium mustum TaxID=2773714 RepID=A0A9N8PLF0_9PEZI|nr:unnamed protein product [Aureobasidium mustum]